MTALQRSRVCWILRRIERLAASDLIDRREVRSGSIPVSLRWGWAHVARPDGRGINQQPKREEKMGPYRQWRMILRATAGLAVLLIPVLAEAGSTALRRNKVRMRRWKLVTGNILAATAIVLGIPSPGSAIPIEYTFSGSGSGTVGATPFSAVNFEIIALADTTNVVSIFTGIFMVQAASASVQLQGIGTATVTEGTGVFSNTGNCSNGPSCVGFSRFTGSTTTSDLLDLSNAAFAGYNLQSSFAPVFDPTPFAVNQFANLSTSLGSLSFSSAQDVTFEASTELAPVPEPSTLLLFGTMAAGLGLVRWR